MLNPKLIACCPLHHGLKAHQLPDAYFPFQTISMDRV